MLAFTFQSVPRAASTFSYRAQPALARRRRRAYYFSRRASVPRRAFDRYFLASSAAAVIYARRQCLYGHLYYFSALHTTLPAISVTGGDLTANILHFYKAEAGVSLFSAYMLPLLRAIRHQLRHDGGDDAAFDARAAGLSATTRTIFRRHEAGPRMPSSHSATEMS